MAVELNTHADLAVIVGQAHGNTDPALNMFTLALDGEGSIIGSIRTRVVLPPAPEYTVRAVARTAGELYSNPMFGQAAQVALVGYGPAAAVDPLLDLAERTIRAEGRLKVFDVLRVHQGRVWSYVCTDDGHRAGDQGEPLDLAGDAAIQMATELARQEGERQ